MRGFSRSDGSVTSALIALLRSGLFGARLREPDRFPGRNGATHVRRRCGCEGREEGRAGWQASPWGPSLPRPGRLTHLQLIEVICAVFPRQTLHNARHRGVAQTGTYGTQSLGLTFLEPCLSWHHVVSLQFTAPPTSPGGEFRLPPTVEGHVRVCLRDTWLF